MNFAKYIDHTYLKQDAQQKDIAKLVDEAKKYQFKTICVNSSWIEYAKKLLSDSLVGITAVVGFPLGACTSNSKAFEATEAIKLGASEIDMVLNIGKLKDGDVKYVLNDIKEVKKACGTKILKVIIETALLSEEEAKLATKIVLDSGVDFVKTSTGFSTRGATFEDVKMMKEIVGNKIGIKAAGGVKTFDDMKKMIELGATRIGTSSGVKLLEGQNSGNDY